MIAITDPFRKSLPSALMPLILTLALR